MRLIWDRVIFVIFNIIIIHIFSDYVTEIPQLG